MDGFKLISKYRKSIMGIAALMILIFHGWDIRFSAVPVLGSFEGFLKQNGYLGVDVFLFLSGYGLFYSMEKGNVKNYYIHRIIKLFPALIISAAIYALVESKGLMYFVKAITGYGFYFENIFFFLWFITAIISISLVFPLYYYLMKKFGNDGLFTFIAIIVWFVLTMCLRNILRYDLFGFTDRLPIFMLGVLVGSISKRETFSFDYKAWIALLLVFLTGIYCVDLYMNKGVEFIVPMSGCFIPAVLFALPFTFLWAGLCELCQNGKFIPKFFKGLDKVFVFVGGFTYELYCLQELVIGKSKSILFKNMGVLTSNILAILLSLAAGYVMFLILNFYKFLGKKKAK